MKRFAIIVVLLYGAIILVLTSPVLVASFYEGKKLAASDFIEAFSLFKSLRYWVLFIIIILCQAALLGVPVETGSRRPAVKRSIIYSVIAVGFVMTFLIVGLYGAIVETATKAPGIGLFIVMIDLAKIKRAILQEKGFQLFLVSFIVVWFIWGLIFYRWSKKLEPKTFVEKQCRFLFAGSVLELLVAVPTHILARSRDYCCAGFSTFIGIALGISVMLLSFGPGVFFLYLERWKKLHPQVKSNPS